MRCEYSSSWYYNVKLLVVVGIIMLNNNYNNKSNNQQEGMFYELLGGRNQWRSGAGSSSLDTRQTAHSNAIVTDHG